MKSFVLPPIITDLVLARNRLRDHYKADNPDFTLDGNLTGYIGEAVAAELLGLRLSARRTGIHGHAPDAVPYRLRRQEPTAVLLFGWSTLALTIFSRSKRRRGAAITITIERLQKMTPKQRATLHENARKRIDNGGREVIELIESSGLPLSCGGMKLSGPVYLRSRAATARIKIMWPLQLPGGVQNS